jgi:hypothetical protein
MENIIEQQTENSNNENEDDKINLKNNIKEWIKIDCEIKQLKIETKERNNKKKIITENLVQVMKKNAIDCFEIKDGCIVYKKSIVKKPINSKSLLLTLQNYYTDQNQNIDVEELSKYILENREKQTKETIKYKI